MTRPTLGTRSDAKRRAGASGCSGRERCGLDLLVVGAGPTGIAIGAAARQAARDALLGERGALTQSILDFPIEMTFFTTRERLEIAGVPFAVPEEKPSRRQALVYYRAVVGRYALPVALHEEVTTVERDPDGFRVRARNARGETTRLARAVALATGYFDQPLRLGVPGEDLPFVRSRYREPYEHSGEPVVVVGGGNSAAETALDLWRNGAHVTLVHRGSGLKPTVKYWLKPDLENRIEEGAIAARFDTTVVTFRSGEVEVATPAGLQILPASAVYVLIGYRPDLALARTLGVEIDPVTEVPRCDPESCESNVPGFYIAGTLQAGRATNQIFIENSRDHGPRIVAHLLRQRRPDLGSPAVGG